MLQTLLVMAPVPALALSCTALQEPFPGWSDTLSAAGGVFLAVGMGILRDLHCDPAVVCDIIPVDHVANMLLAAAVKTAADFAGCREALVLHANVCTTPAQLQHNSHRELGGTLPQIKVYHCSTSASTNPLTWGMVCLNGSDPFVSDSECHTWSAGDSALLCGWCARSCGSL